MPNEKILETKVFHRLKERICRPEDRFEHVENGLGAGMPDINYCMFGCEGWVEIKCPTIPARVTSALFGSSHQLGIEQSNWFLRQAAAGGRAYLFIATREILMLVGSALVERHSVFNKLPLAEFKTQALWQAPIPVIEQARWVKLRGILSSHTPVRK